jgi:hypothetical protein
MKILHNPQFLILYILLLCVVYACFRAIVTRPPRLTEEDIAALRKQFPDAKTGYELAEKFGDDCGITNGEAYQRFSGAFLKSQLK